MVAKIITKMEQLNSTEKEKRTIRFTVRFSQSEFLQLKENAKKSWLSIATYLRQCGLQHQPKARLSESELNIYRQLVGMASNLNTLVKLSHSENLITMMKEIISLRDSISGIISKLKQ
jgi:hypothetical protein